MDKARKKEITVDVIFWSHFKRKDGTCSIKLKVTSNRVTKYYPIQRSNKNIFLNNKHWDGLWDKNVRGDLKEIKDTIDQARVAALDAVEQITQGGRPFTYERFEKVYFAHEEGTKGFMGVFKAAADNLLLQERAGTYRAYLTAMASFKRYLEYKNINDLTAYDLTADMLYDYEKYMTKVRTASRTTVGIYTRVLRVIYNICADVDPNLKQCYPFGSKRGKYRMQNSAKGYKKGQALSVDQLKTLIATDPKPFSPLWEAKQFWLFSFYCQGMNFRDIFLLKYSNIQGQFIRYTREKTKRTEDQEIIEIPINDQITQIIITLGSLDKRPNTYVFPLLDQTEKDIMKTEATLMQKIQVTNARLKKLCGSVGLPPITTYWSRHSYASLLKMAGVSVDLIRELLGHSDIKTTEHYLKRFDLDVKRQANQKITDLLLQKAS